MEAQERDAAELLRPLVREPRSASTVDIARAVADGERRLRTVRLVGTGSVAALVVLVLLSGWLVLRPAHRPSPIDRNSASPVASTPVPSGSPSPTEPTAPGSCAAQRLPVPDGHPPKSVVTGGDPTGRYLVGRSFPNDAPRPVIWDRGVVRAVPMTGTEPLLSDINANGVAVGSSGSTSKPTAWVYQDGQLSRLAGADARATGVNERGVIVGSVGGKPAKWTSPTSQPTMLPLPAGATGSARGIDEDGTIVGEVHGNGSTTGRGYVWRADGSAEQLPTPTLAGAPAADYTADAIRDGWVIGWVSNDSPTTSIVGGARWNLRTGEVTSFPGTGLSAVNRYGWMVGDESGEGGSAVLLARSSKVILRGSDGPGRAQGAIATFIGDDGMVVAGQAPTDAAVMAAVQWTCR